MRTATLSLVLALLSNAALAAVTVTPRDPRANESITISSDEAGELVWGVNGWRLPGTNDRPLGSRVVDSVLRSPLQSNGSSYAITVGPFNEGRAYELNFVIRTSRGAWIKDSGQDFRIAIQSLTPSSPITIGPGPRLGRTAGQDFFEEFQDWRQADGRSLDVAGDGLRLNDGGDDCRDLVAFYSRRENNNLFLRADFFDLSLGAETGLVNVIVLVDLAPGGQTWLPDFLLGQTTQGWELAIIFETKDKFRVLDSNWQTVCAPGHRQDLWRGSYIRSDLDALELGISLDALRNAGWDGRRELRFQALSTKPGMNKVCDLVGEAGAPGMTFGASCSERDGVGTAKFASILHGNQHVKRASEVAELIRNHHLKTPAGNETGYARALETHQTFKAKVNVHLSATLMSACEWARNPDPKFDGPAFNAWVRHLVEQGHAALVGGVLAEHIAPFFEASGVNSVSARLEEEVREAIYGTVQPRIYWTPERVIRAATFKDILDSGYQWTVLDQHNHIWKWYGRSEALSNKGYKINKINGVNCFLINDDADQRKFWNSDGGAHHELRNQLLGKALDSDQQQLVLVFDDWEAYAGRSFTSFGVGSDNPDNYNRTVRWIANKPWIQLVTLDEVASWNWTPVDRGFRSDLGMTTYHWLNHATQTSYEDWYYGSHQEENFAALVPPLRAGKLAHKRFGDVWTPGTLFHDVWKEVEAAPAGNLKTLAEATYTTAIFETAWHDEDQNDYHARDHNNNYLNPDRSFDRVSDWAFGMHNKVRDASIIAAAAHWAASRPGAATRVENRDVDNDGEGEWVLSNNRIFAVFEDDGGRLIMAFTRRERDGAAFGVIGAPVVDPGARRESEIEGDFRISALRDHWAENGGDRYINMEYSLRAVTNGLELRSADGKIRKTVTLSADRLEVSYDIDASVGTLYIRNGLSPHVWDLMKHGQSKLSRIEQNERFGLRNDSSDGPVLAMLEGRGWTTRVPDSSLNDGRNAALTQQVEMALRGRGSFTLILSAW